MVPATAASIAFGNDNLAGIVLTPSVVSSKKIGAVPRQDLAVIRIPVLVLHHEKDTCKLCSPYEVSAIINGLRNAPVDKNSVCLIKISLIDNKYYCSVWLTGPNH